MAGGSATGGQTPSALTSAARLPLDFPLSVRFTSWEAGFDQDTAQDFYRQADIDEGYWEAQNLDFWSEGGTARMLPKIVQIDADATDREYLLRPFGTAIYRVPTANFSAALFQKTTQATGTPTWQALANIYPGATACRNAVVWRDKLVVVANEQGASAVRSMSSAEVWTAIAAAAPAPTTANASMVGVAHDDRLLVWFESNGLYAYDGSAWVKIFPPATNPGISADIYCDAIAAGIGATLFVTRDTTGQSTFWEWTIEPAGQVFNAWTRELGLRIWPDGLETYDDSSWIGARIGSHQNLGILWSKERLAPLNEIQQITSNRATAGQVTYDWAVRCLYSVGDLLYVGSSSRQDHNCCIYRLTSEDEGDVMHPTVVGSGISGPVYSIANLPYGATGASTTDRLFFVTAAGTFYRDMENGADPTQDAPAGILELPDIDLGVGDHDKVWQYVEVHALQRSSRSDGVSVQYRLDPSGPDEGWIALGDLSLTTATTHIDFPDDDETVAEYGSRSRLLQLRLVFRPPLSGTLRDIVDSIVVVAARLIPLARAAT